MGRSPDRCDIGYRISLEVRNQRYREQVEVRDDVEYQDQVEVRDDVEYRDQVEVRSFDVTDRSTW